MIVNLFNRDFTARAPLDADIQVVEYSFSDVGGCFRAQLVVRGSANAVWALVNDLRCPVEIYDDNGVRVWWGYLHETVINAGAITMAANLSTMANNVRVAYSYVEAGTSTVGKRNLTTAVTNTSSQAIYGVKEYVHSVAGMTTAEAEALTAKLGADMAFPKGGISTGGAQAQVVTASLYCRGWWDTLFWRYPTIAASSVEITAQITTLVTGYAAFITGVSYETTTSINVGAYADGTKTAGEIIEGLMKTASATGRALLATVTPERIIYIWQKPLVSTIGYIVDTDGTVRMASGDEVRPTKPPVGAWVGLSGVVPAVVDTGIISNEAVQYITQSGWKEGQPFYSYSETFYGKNDITPGRIDMIDLVGNAPRFVGLTAPLTSTSFDGDAFSTTAKTLIDLSAVFSAPASIKAVLVKCTIRDSGSAASKLCGIRLSPNDTANSGALTVLCSGVLNDAYISGAGIVPCEANGDIYYQLTATGAGTLDVTIEIWGYWI